MTRIKKFDILRTHPNGAFEVRRPDGSAAFDTLHAALAYAEKKAAMIGAAIEILCRFKGAVITPPGPGE